MTDKVKRGELLTVELPSIGPVTWEATAMLVRALGEKWAITPNAYEVLLCVAARYGSPELLNQPQAPTAPQAKDDDGGGLLVIPVQQPSRQVAMFERGEALKGTEFVTMRQGVAVIPIEGTILPRANFFTQVSGLATLDLLKLDLGFVASSPDVRAIVLSIDSPGGALADVNEFSKLVKEVDARKPVLVHVNNLMASAALWIGSAAREIWIDETAQLGSVGVIMSVIRQTPEEKARRAIFVYSKAPDKAPDIDTDPGKAVLQSHVDQLGDIFVEVIAANRGLTAEQVLQARGGMLIGKSAITAGFADRIGTLEQTIAHARTLATSSIDYLRGVAANHEQGDNHAEIRRHAAR